MISDFRKTYFYMSNFYARKLFTYKDRVWQTSEHTYQAEKTDDPEWYNKIHQAETPRDARDYGQMCPVKDNFENDKLLIMTDILFARFADVDLKARLIATGNEYLMEGNWWHDNYWGNCTCNECVDIPGLNNLGKSIMLVRKHI